MADIAKPAEKPKWATGGSAAVTTPPSGKQDLGWVIEYPPHQFFNWLAKWTYRWIEYFEAKGDSSLGGAAETTLTLVSGVATPTLGKHRIDTEGAAAADDLTHLAQSGLDDGRLLFIRSVSAGRVVTVKHLAGGTGEINLRLGADLVLDDPNKWLLLTRNGTQWVEVMASFLGADPAPHLGADLDVRARKITTSTTNGDVVVEPNGTGALAPETTGKALGKATARWAAFLASADVAGNILPDSDSARDLGATGTRWDEIFGDFGSFTNWVRTASIDSEASGGTLNIGDVQAALINIGRVGATIALHGSVTEVHTTNTFVQDKLVTFNDGGLAATGGDSGFEIEEDGSAAGWVKTTADRQGWRFKAPGNANEFTLTPAPGNALIGFLPLGAIIATMPHLTGAYSCTATTVADANGFVLCNGQTISDPSSPMNGAVIPNINDDVFLMGTAGVTNGGQLSSNTKNLSHTHTVSISETNLPPHSHSIDHDHGSVTSGNQSADHTHTFSSTSGNQSADHTHSVSATTGTESADHSHSGSTSTDGAHAHRTSHVVGSSSAGFHTWTPSTVSGGATFGFGYGDLAVSSTNSAHSHAFSTGGRSAAHTHSFSTTSGTVSANHTHSVSGTTAGMSVSHNHSVDLPNYTGSSGNGAGTSAAITSGASLSSSFDVRPKYISAKFIMRIK